MHVTPETWIISDTHFGHKNIVKYCSRPMDHNSIMIRNWKELVKAEDAVLHLGDLAVWYGDDEEYWQYVASQLPGQKFMLRGNHDHAKNFPGFTIIPEFIQEIKRKRVLFSHYPDETRVGQWDVNIHGHIHNNAPAEKFGGRNHINVSIEVMDYKPKRLCDIL